MKHKSEANYITENESVKRLRTDKQVECAPDPPMAYPFFHYEDYSEQPDPDPLVPLTGPGRVPNFPAKMHAILSRNDLASIICWMPHGRSWKVHKQREFEVLVLPHYFEHSKFSSFIRQANGWGFRRINTGPDRNSYYHPQFLRGLPHLCKSMKRPGVAQKMQLNPDHEPDLYKISERHPVPTKTAEESIMLLSTLVGGPKARQTISSILPHVSHSSLQTSNYKMDGLGHREREALSTFCTSLGYNDDSLVGLAHDFSNKITSISPSPSYFNAEKFFESSTEAELQEARSIAPSTIGTNNQNDSYNVLSAANNLAFMNQPNNGTTNNANFEPIDIFNSSMTSIFSHFNGFPE